MFVDVHTHDINTDNHSVIKIVNLGFLVNTSWGGDFPVPFSVGIHPWDADENFDLDEFSDILKEKKAVAVGESGLDKAHKETLTKQHEIFLKMIDFSERFRKPLIIHAVRTYSDIISTRNKTKSKMPWIIHGFQGSPESARQLTSHGIYLSFGELLYRNENQAVKALKATPIEKMFFETDVSGRNIADVYEKAAALMDCGIDFLEEKIFDNFKTIFSDGKLEKQDAHFGW